MAPTDSMGKMEKKDGLSLTTYGQSMALNADEKAASLFKLYGLTRGEAALAVHLLQGKSIEHAAAELSISRPAARAHLKRIFMKTDQHSSSETVASVGRDVIRLKSVEQRGFDVAVAPDPAGRNRSEAVLLRETRGAAEAGCAPGT